jgi:hypothetical protein
VTPRTAKGEEDEIFLERQQNTEQHLVSVYTLALFKEASSGMQMKKRVVNSHDERPR